jgi:uncharacterized membrane protein YgaE (UPF0421/DUF939 family)
LKKLRKITLNNATSAHLKHAAKTGLAAVIAFYLARFLNLPESYWAAISAIIVMYSDVSRTVKASGYRLIGTAIGVSVGGAFAALFGQRVWAFGLAVAITVFVCGLLGFAEAARLAGVAVAIVMLAGHPGRPWTAAVHRFLEVSLGIVIAVLVSALIWPARSSKWSWAVPHGSARPDVQKGSGC